ncbi:MAG: sulfite exporter TauE/SafE family protein [Planctomycetota bacterium]|nr:sulfite exporter TauE/SafE family protein [Planctomycetota bacterium]
MQSVPLGKLVLLILLLTMAIVFAIGWVRSLSKKRSEGIRPSPYQLLIGFVTDFLDTLGVGSFATTTSLFRLGKVVDDDKIPGTLNVGHTLPTILQALIYINIVEIDLWTLWILIIASVAGSYLGATFVSRLSKKSIQMGMGGALLVAVSLIISKLMGWIPSGGESLGLSGWSLLIGVIGNFAFGAMMTIGVGAYAPIMIMVSLLGMNQKSAFPLMMGSCAILMPVASYRFISSGKYDAKAALGLTLLGLPGVAIAAWIVKELRTDYVNWLVVFVVIYTAVSMLYSASKADTTSTNLD